MRIKQLGNNQTEVQFKNARVLVSYQTPVAVEIKGRAYRTSKHWSTTTSKHINKWLDGMKAEDKPQEFFDNILEEIGR